MGIPLPPFSFISLSATHRALNNEYREQDGQRRRLEEQFIVFSAYKHASRNCRSSNSCSFHLLSTLGYIIFSISAVNLYRAKISFFLWTDSDIAVYVSSPSYLWERSVNKYWVAYLLTAGGFDYYYYSYVGNCKPSWLSIIRSGRC